MTRSAEVPLPPFEYRTLVCGPNSESTFEDRGREQVERLKAQQMLAEGADLLDVGCGCGRLARFLLDERIGSYEGFDRHSGMIDWCNRHLAPLDPRFRFRHVDVKSVYVEWDAHAGTIAGDALVLPYPDDAFDSIVLASVFTHMPLHEARHYLGELQRVVRPAGRILLSVFFAEGEAHRRDQVNFFFEPDRFLAAVSAAGFAALPLAAAPAYGYVHNWYVLTPAG